VLDVVTGECSAPNAIPRPGVCPSGQASLLAAGRFTCVDRDATCPRGSGRDADVCARPARCPPGTLPIGADCRPIVSRSARAGRTTVDVGAWVAIVLGPDGGSGSADLCRPLLQRIATFDDSADPLPIRIRISLDVPDQDLAGVHGETVAWREGADAGAAGDGETALSAPLQAAVRDSVGTLLEPLRSLGGEASAAHVKAEVRCRPSAKMR